MKGERLKKRINNRLFERVANIANLTVNEVQAQYEAAQDKTAYLENALGGEDISVQNKNLLAIYKELNSSKKTSDAYMFEVFCDKDLQEIRSDLKDDLDAIILADNQQMKIWPTNYSPYTLTGTPIVTSMCIYENILAIFFRFS